jgi:DNA-binding MarR family transcriptional regulator
MEINPMSTTQDIADQFVEIIQGFVQLRPKLITPEHAPHFSQQMESLKNSGMVNFEDRPLLFRTLILLSRSKTPPTMGELSGELGIPLSSATRIVDGLVNANLLERVNDPLDRRVVRIQMSEYGKQFSQTATDHIKQHITRLLGSFSPAEQEQLLHLVTKLFRSMEAESKNVISS